MNDIDSKTKAELIQIGSSIGLNLSERMKKKDMIDEIISYDNKPKPIDLIKDDYSSHAKFDKFKKGR